MSAPMANTDEIPNQHIQQELCTTRPAYREGRNPKAVKVYTVNQESRYLLFQGVPALGTTQELIKLCAIHGAVEEYRMLDEFPSADKFTDVVLVKFKRIQSARHAKKKLDNWSFYGGVLHVSYAPEYESVEETRDKLQDRRKAIAARLRMLGKDQNRKKDQPSESQPDPEYVQGKTSQHFVPEKIESRIPSLHSDKPNINMNSAGSNGNSNFSPWQDQMSNNYAGGSQNTNHGGPRQSQISNNYGGASHDPYNRAPFNQNLQNNQSGTFHMYEEHYTQNEGQLPSTSGYHDNNGTQQQTLVIPPPPKREPFLNASKLKQKGDKFNFAKVPTANAPFPVDFDARTGVEKNMEDISKKEFLNQDSQKQTMPPKTQLHHNPGNLSHPKYQKIFENAGMKNEKLIVKDFKKAGSTPKFIPRQTLNLLKPKSDVPKVSSNDELGKQIRKNAVVLGDKQGPAEIPEKFKKQEVTPTEKAVEKSVAEIRKRMSVFAPEPEKSKKPKTE